MLLQFCFALLCGCTGYAVDTNHIDLVKPSEKNPYVLSILRASVNDALANDELTRAEKNLSCRAYIKSGNLLDVWTEVIDAKGDNSSGVVPGEKGFYRIKIDSLHGDQNPITFTGHQLENDNIRYVGSYYGDEIEYSRTTNAGINGVSEEKAEGLCGGLKVFVVERTMKSNNLGYSHTWEIRMTSSDSH